MCVSPKKFCFMFNGTKSLYFLLWKAVPYCWSSKTTKWSINDSGLPAANGCCSPYTCCVEYDVLDDGDQHIDFAGMSAGILARTRGFGGARHGSNVCAACAPRQHFAPMFLPPQRHPTHIATGLFSKDSCTF